MQAYILHRKHSNDYVKKFIVDQNGATIEWVTEKDAALKLSSAELEASTFLLLIRGFELVSEEVIR